MSWLSIRPAPLRPPERTLGTDAREATPQRPDSRPAQRCDSSFEPAPTSRKPTDWWKGRPLSEGKNAHSTNTREDFDRAIADGSNWLEGDIRQEINPPHEMEMRHDTGHEPGDNLLLREWLEEGKASGRGLKLDVKEGKHLARILDLAESSGIPSERLMFNLGDGDMSRWAEQIRQRFPDSTLAINPASSLDGKQNSGPLQDWQVERMIELAKKGGAPATFVVRQDLLTDTAIQALREHGTVSVWNSPSMSGVSDVAALTAELRGRGVDGVIDLRPSMSNFEKVKTGISAGFGWVRGKLS